MENVERRYKETALKAFALACKSNLDDRAMELMQMLGNPQLLNLCVKYAGKQNRRLAEKLMEIGPLLNGYDANSSDLTGSVRFFEIVVCGVTMFSVGYLFFWNTKYLYYKASEQTSSC